MSAGTPTLLEMLLQEQQTLSAVDVFSTWHSNSQSVGSQSVGSQSGDSQSIASRYQALMPATALRDGQQYAFEVDLDTCSGCKACVVACHNLNGLEESETWRKVGLLTSKSVSLPVVQHVTTACHHCVDPACMNGCPVLAYEKDKTTGIVKHLDDQCFGCQYCTMMCPYEVPQYSHTLGIVRKCDMCSQRLNVGEAPACVQACPNQAIRINIVDKQSIIDENHGNQTLALVASAPPSRITLPTTRYLISDSLKSSTLTQADVVPEFSRYVSSPTLADKPQHGHWPLAMMLVLTQASVGMFCCMAMLVLVSGSLFQSSNAGELLIFSIVATSVGIAGVHLALLHLGRPMYAFRAFLGWRKSWLSREAILFGVYMGAMTVTTGAWWFADKLPGYVPPLLTFTTAFIGVTSVASSAMIYIATNRSLWSTHRTMWDFGITTLGLGIACSHLFVDGSTQSNPSIATLLMAIGLLLTMASGLYGVLDWKAGTNTKIAWEDFSARSGRLLRRDLRYVWWAMWVAYAIAFAMIIGAANVDGKTTQIAIGGLFCLSVVAAKFVGRWLYFASVVTYRMPGAES